MPHKERPRRLEYHRRYYAENRDLVKKAALQRYSDNAEQIKAERALKRSDETRAKNSELQKQRYRRLRHEVIAAYGGKCACCAEQEVMFLELDHINGDGAEHRRSIGRGSSQTYKWVKLNGFPESFQLLCANCNQGRQRNGGICPHAR